MQEAVYHPTTAAAILRSKPLLLDLIHFVHDLWINFMVNM